MKLLRAALAAALMLLVVPALAENVGLRWEHPGGADGFEVLCGDKAGTYATQPAGSAIGSARTITLTFQGSMAGVVTKYCAARAYVGANKSVLSNEVRIDLAVVPVPPPQNLETYQIQAVIDRDSGEVVAVSIERMPK